MYANDSTSLAPYIPGSWKQLLRQIEHLAQFGGAVQVVSGGEGSGKTTFLRELSRHGLTDLVLWPVVEESWPGQSLQSLLNALNADAGQSIGESIVALRRFSQNLQRQKKRVVVAVDDSDLLTDASLAGVASVLQGGAEEGFGLHLIFFTEKSLADRLDQLQLIDVSVYDFDLPCFTLQEVGELLEIHYDDIVQREPIRPLDKDELQDIWLESQGLPGLAVDLAKEKWAMGLMRKNRFSLAGMPFVHIAALLLLVGVLIWALWVREKTTDSAANEIVTQLPAPGAAAPNPASSLPIEMKKIEMPAPAAVPPADVQKPADAVAVIEAPAALPPVAVEPAAPVKAPEPVAPVKAVPEPAPVPVIAPTRADPKPKSEPVKAEIVKPEPAAKVIAPKPEIKPVEVKPEIAKPEIAKPEPVKPAVKPAPVESDLPPAEELQAISRGSSGKPIAPAGDATSLAAGVKKLAKLPETGYVLQIQISSSAKKIEDALAAAPNKKDLAAYRTLRDGKEVFILVEGSYPDANAAAAAIKQLPADQKAAQPWPKKVGLIHAELKTAGVKN